MSPRTGSDGWLVGAYAAAPSRTGGDLAAEAAFLDAIDELPGVAGLELPFDEALHPIDEGWLLRRLDPATQVVITALPGTARRQREDPAHGLASADPAGRRSALTFAETVRAAVHRVGEIVGPGMLAVHLHSAPRVERSSLAAWAASLDEILGWDWGSARVVVEHCDTVIPGRDPAKGYLALDDELASVLAVAGGFPTQAGVAINWGRSVVEQRDADAGRAQVAAAVSAGVLAGVFFSGAAPEPTPVGPAWADSHGWVAPLGSGSPEPGTEPTSLLTVERIAETLAAAGDRPLLYRGVKVGAPASADPASRVAAVARLLEAAELARRTAAIPSEAAGCPT